MIIPRRWISCHIPDHHWINKTSFEGPTEICDFIKKQNQPLEVFHEENCSWNFEKFTGKHLCQSLFFNKVAALEYLFYRTPLGDCFQKKHQITKKKVLSNHKFRNVYNTAISLKKSTCSIYDLFYKLHG